MGSDARYGEAGPALLSPCRIYRYTLERVWDIDRPRCAFVGLNPSTADEHQLDPTLRRCVRFADSWGYGSFIMLNVYAFRSTDWRGVQMYGAPVGPDNDKWVGRTVLEIEGNGGIVICCWGTHVKDIRGGLDRSAAVCAMISRPYYIRMTRSGYPEHPLYLPSNLEPEPWST
jgi:hypothetical protein